ncbi:MAG TPA: SAM-dependent methyltransferase [Actinospica sp.]|nr:SAM-dependent methyltransferase [Actinospica sp.]
MSVSWSNPNGVPVNSARPRWAPDSVDIERPSAARMYDYYLGGSHNFQADRRLANEYMRVLPEMPVIAQAQRGVLTRAVRVMVEAGIDQFLDLGSGMPTTGNVHEIAQAMNPEVRTVYVDVDPVAVAHGRALLRDDEGHTGVVHADLRDPAFVLAQTEVGELLDLSRPVGVLMIAVLHFVADADDPAGVVAAYRDVSASGSYLAITHATSDYQPAMAKNAEEVYLRASHQLHYRTKREIAALLAGYELVEPGLVDLIHWRPEPNAGPDPLDGDVTRYSGYAAVGRKP